MTGEVSPAATATSSKCASKGFPDGAGLAWGFTERCATPCPSKWPAEATADKVTNKRRVISMKKAFFAVPAKAHAWRAHYGNVYRTVYSIRRSCSVQSHREKYSRKLAGGETATFKPQLEQSIFRLFCYPILNIGM